MDADDRDDMLSCVHAYVRRSCVTVRQIKCVRGRCRRRRRHIVHCVIVIICSQRTLSMVLASAQRRTVRTTC